MNLLNSSMILGTQFSDRAAEKKELTISYAIIIE